MRSFDTLTTSLQAGLPGLARPCRRNVKHTETPSCICYGLRSSPLIVSPLTAVTYSSFVQIHVPS